MADIDGDPFYDASTTSFGRKLLLELSDGVTHNTLRIGQHYNQTAAFRAFCGAEGKTGMRTNYPTCVACVSHVFKKTLPL